MSSGGRRRRNAGPERTPCSWHSSRARPANGSRATGREFQTRTRSRAYSREVDSRRVANSRCAPPPCGEGLGVGVRQRITARPPPRRFATAYAAHRRSWCQERRPEAAYALPSRLRACPLPAKLKITKPRQAGVWLGRVEPSLLLALIQFRSNTLCDTTKLR